MARGAAYAGDCVIGHALTNPIGSATFIVTGALTAGSERRLTVPAQL